MIFHLSSYSDFFPKHLRRQTPEEGPRKYRPKRCGNNNKDEDNSPKTLNDKNHQASSQKFRVHFFFCLSLIINFIPLKYSFVFK